MVNKTSKLIYHIFGFNKLYLIKYLIFFQFIFFFVSGFPAYSQVDTAEAKPEKEKKPKKILPLFDSNEPLSVTLRFDVTQFLKKSPKAGSFEGEMIFSFNNTDTIDKNIKIKSRGINRRDICNFPPIEINFKNPLYVYSDSGKIKKIKLVTHCQAGQLYEDYVLREYLVYKLYNVLTDSSFRVRLLKVTYLDTGKDRKPIENYGILIEPKDILALRTNSTLIESTNLDQRHIVPEPMTRLAVFYYMVSNWDWSIPGQHNVAILKPNDFTNPGLGIAVPYDFDRTGIVNTEYSGTPPELNLKDCRDRIFQGMCYNRERYQKALNEIKSKKGELYSVINDFSLLSQRSKKDITIYLDSFFDQLEKQKDIEMLINNFVANCKKL
jgi:hypothetical protein